MFANDIRKLLCVPFIFLWVVYLVCHSQSYACLDFMVILAVRSNISHKRHIPLLQISGLLMMARSVPWSECAVLG